MRLLSVDLEGFGRFARRQQWRLPRLHGLFHMTGENRDEPRLGANATGKSTLWEAVCWCLYGRTSRGILGPQVVTWGQQSASVTVRCQVADRILTISRHQSPNGLTMKVGSKGPYKVSQREIDEAVGATFPVFTTAVFLGQFGRMFLELSPAEKLRTVSEALGLDRWERRSEHSRLLAKSARQEEAAARERAERSRGRASALREAAGRALREAEAAAEEASAEGRAAVAEARDAKIRAREARREADRLRESLPALRAAVEAARERRDDAEGRIRAWEDRRAKLIGEAASAEADAERLRERYRQLEDAGGSTCPLCELRVDHKHAEDLLDKIKAHGQWLMGERDRCLEKAGAIERRLDRYAERLRGVLIPAYEDARDALRAAEGSAREAEREAERASAEERAARGRAKAATGRRRASTAEAERLRADAAEAWREVAVHAGVAARRGLRAEQYEFWQDRFRDLRLVVLDRSLRELEITVNAGLVELGLGGWSVRFEVERPRSGGGLSKNFHTLIQSPTSVEPRRWESWSGGETTRLKVAGSVGLSRLLGDRLGFVSGIEVWDEPTSYLSREGVADLMAYLRERAERERKQIWIVDHHILDSGGFDGEVTVVRENGHSMLGVPHAAGLGTAGGSA